MTPAVHDDLGKVRLPASKSAETRHQTKQRNGQQRDVQAIMKQWVHLVHVPGSGRAPGV